MAVPPRHRRAVRRPSPSPACSRLRDRLPAGPVGVVLSGGNADWNTYRPLLDSAMERINSDAPVLH
ncbi:hypothetical protein ACFV9D_05425 [Streptomyces sp. NPDC059875]|uniref:hypothetical protein n=1 Tax=unclassified Streptomyces TaxID=2593676 RepID=UPI00364BFD33